MDRTFKANGIDIANCRAVLDFGCGCGRVIRRWRHLAPHVELHRTDYNHAIKWCAANLPFARFNTNQLEPPLAYPDGKFDLVFAFSVFTHLPEALANRWLAELRRIIAPGGHLLLTVHGAGARAVLTEAERGRFDAGELIVRYESVAGSNMCAVFHPEHYLRTTLARDWRLVSHTDPGVGQDFVLLRKPGPADSMSGQLAM